MNIKYEEIIELKINFSHNKHKEFLYQLINFKKLNSDSLSDDEFINFVTNLTSKIK